MGILFVAFLFPSAPSSPARYPAPASQTISKNSRFFPEFCNLQGALHPPFYSPNLKSCSLLRYLASHTGLHVHTHAQPKHVLLFSAPENEIAKSFPRVILLSLRTIPAPLAHGFALNRRAQVIRGLTHLPVYNLARVRPPFTHLGFYPLVLECRVHSDPVLAMQPNAPACELIHTERFSCRPAPQFCSCPHIHACMHSQTIPLSFTFGRNLPFANFLWIDRPTVQSLPYSQVSMPTHQWSFETLLTWF